MQWGTIHCAKTSAPSTEATSSLIRSLPSQSARILVENISARLPERVFSNLARRGLPIARESDFVGVIQRWVEDPWLGSRSRCCFGRRWRSHWYSRRWEHWARDYLLLQYLVGGCPLWRRGQRHWGSEIFYLYIHRRDSPISHRRLASQV